ncbi:hypothetical protein BC835DRAFT_1422881 [Cytidiella melzeri]|nr:hypothetical protein BC835DRAFT_1422881 [Cytidiella melzeri]
MSSTTPFIRSAPTSFRLALPTGTLSSSSHVLTLGPTGNSTTTQNTPLISGIGGAGLVIVFAACGLLFTILVTTLTIRSIRDRRATRQSGGTPRDDLEGSGHRRPSSPEFGEKPQMCDVHVSLSQAYAARSQGLWRNMQPISASRDVDSMTLPTLARTKRASSVFSIDSTYSQESEPMSPNPPDGPPPRYAMDLARPSPMSPKPTNVSVAIPIAMPRQPPSAHCNPWEMASPHDVDLEKEKGSYFEYSFRSSVDAHIPEFCLGVAEVRQHSQAREKQL